MTKSDFIVAARERIEELERYLAKSEREVEGLRERVAAIQHGFNRQCNENEKLKSELKRVAEERDEIEVERIRARDDLADAEHGYATIKAELATLETAERDAYRHDAVARGLHALRNLRLATEEGVEIVCDSNAELTALRVQLEAAEAERDKWLEEARKRTGARLRLATLETAAREAHRLMTKAASIVSYTYTTEWQVGVIALERALGENGR